MAKLFLVDLLSEKHMQCNMFIALKRVLFFSIFSISILHAQINISNYDNVFNHIDSMLVGYNTINFKVAVFEVERVFLNNNPDFLNENEKLQTYIELIRQISNLDSINYDEKDRNQILLHSSMFKFFTEPIPIIIDTTHALIHKPFTYDFDDMWGEKDWKNMFVSKLLETGKGNCHSMPYLYKILADELGIPAYLAFAPNHIYIKTYSQKMGWYNTELTSGTFPIDAWIMASGYVTVEAIQNGLYMDTLSTKQSVANCLVDLAQGYQHKFGKDNPEFVVKCCNTCLKYHPTNVNAMLTKAEAQKYYIQAQMKAKNVKTPQQLFADNSFKEMYEDMEQTYVRLHQLGYRRMPEEMYMQWMGILENDPAKYNNPKISTTKKKK